MSQNLPWPEIPLNEWIDTCETLHRWTQVVGKVRMALTPLVNHWWNVTLYVTSRGLTTSPIPYGTRTFEITFDFIDHRLRIETSDGGAEHIALLSMSVADFHAIVMERLGRLDIVARIWTMPSEIADAVPFEQDRAHARYDAFRVQQFWLALMQCDRVFKKFRARFLGKVSPVHFFWGSFDLAVTRFSGRKAPPPSGQTPNVAGWVMAEAYSHEVCSCGFWPGNGGYGRAAFNVYAYPEPVDYGSVKLATPDAFYDQGLGQFILPYDVVRQATDSDRHLLGFLQETYEAAANLAQWDRRSLERASPSAVLSAPGSESR